MDPHTHMSTVHMLAYAGFFFVLFGTLHLLALSSDSRWARAFIATGF